MFLYPNDAQLPPRNSKDSNVNSQGRNLIGLCRESGLRVINGRTVSDPNGEITFQNRQGTSMIDLAAIHFSAFKLLKDLEVGNFTEFSDHAPVTLVLKTTFSVPQLYCACKRRTTTSTSWNPENAQQLYECMLVNQDSLSACVYNIADINETIHSLTSTIKSITDKFCTKTYTYTDVCEFCKLNKQLQKNVPENKPWFTDECVRKYKLYKNALLQFNNHKTFQNRINLANAKNAYKTCETKMKRHYFRQEGNMLDNMKRDNPKQFYRIFRKKRKSCKSNLNVKDFFQYFSNLMSGADIEPQHTDETHCVFNELDEDFTDEKISEQKRNLKKDKAPGIDGLLNEMFVKCETIFLPVLKKLFNHILSTGVYPEQWSKGIVIPVYKKGDDSDTGNYRPITLISHLAKLFTSVLNRRLLHWCETNNCLTDAQFGFRPAHSTCDAIFALHSLISEYLNKKKKLYCCFVDYLKAFDSIDHAQLWRRMVKVGITGKLLNVIKSMYQQIKSCVRFNNELSDFYTCFKGLVQGEALSPLIFSLFVNDIELDLLHDCSPLQLNDINVFLLMYADDTVLLAESSEDLQRMLDSLLHWTRKYKLTVNVDKTKVVIFRGSWQTGDDTFYYNGNLVEIVNTFSYLGLLLNYNGKFNVTQKHIAAQGKKCLFGLMKEVKKHNFNVATTLSLFDTYVKPVLNYCSEIWGYIKAQDVEKIHTMFIKRLLGVKRSASNDMIYCETGRLPLIVNRKFNMLKYWLKLTRTENCILKARTFMK